PTRRSSDLLRWGDRRRASWTVPNATPARMGSALGTSRDAKLCRVADRGAATYLRSDSVRTLAPGTPLAVTGEVIAPVRPASLAMIRLRTLGTLELTDSRGLELRAVL